MVALALDIGETRIGIAVSSRDGKMAMPVKVLPAAEVTGMAKTFRYLVEDYEPDILVSGRPLTMAGEPGPQAVRVAAVAQKIADELDLPLEFEDERLSSQEAKRILREQGLNEKQMRGKIDMIAASLFLQTWLDRKNEEVSHAWCFRSAPAESYTAAGVAPCPAWPASGTADAARSSACRAPGAVLLSFGPTCSTDGSAAFCSFGSAFGFSRGSAAHCSYGPACRRHPL